jgi:hypothetical protein
MSMEELTQAPTATTPLKARRGQQITDETAHIAAVVGILTTSAVS